MGFQGLSLDFPSSRALDGAEINSFRPVARMGPVKRLALVLIAALCAFGSGPGALAADMPVKAAKPVAVVAPFSWAGFYIGVNAGGSWADGSVAYQSRFTGPGNIFAVCGSPPGVATAAPTFPNPFDLSGQCSDKSSFAGGGQIGYNWQRGVLVYGL